MKTALWWLLGLGIVGGGGYYLYDKYGKEIKAKDACIADLPEPNKSQVLQAIKDKNSNKLLTYADQAELEMGWICAAKQMREAVASITAGQDTKEIEKKIDPKAGLDGILGTADDIIDKVCISNLPEPDKSQVIQAIKDINVPALTNYLAKAKANNWNCTVDEINTFIKEVKDSKILDKKKVEKVTESKEDLDLTKTFKVINTPSFRINFSTKDLPSDVKAKIKPILESYFKWTPAYSASEWYNPTYLDNLANSIESTYSAKSAANMLRDYASQIRAATASKVQLETAKADWPGIMEIDDAKLASRARPLALNLTKSMSDTVDASGTVWVVQVLNGYTLPSADDLTVLINDLNTLYPGDFDTAIQEIKLIRYAENNGNVV